MLALNSSSAALTRQSFRNALSELHPRSGLGMLSGLFRIIVPIPRVETLGFYESSRPFGTIQRIESHAVGSLQSPK